jgi:hypothetical protein
MKYRCQMCKRFEGGADTREGFVLHMRLYHAVTITVENIMDLEGLTPYGKRRDECHKAMLQRRKERASAEACQ